MSSVVNKYLPDETPATQVTPLQHLYDVCDEVSVEAFAVGGLGDWFTRKGATITHALTEAFRYIATSDFTKPEVINSRQLRQMLSTVQYSELMEYPAHIPVGLNAGMRDYTTLLQGNVKTLLIGLLSNVIVPAQKRFGHYLSHPNDVNERRDFAHGSMYSAKNLEEIKGQMGGFLQTGSHSSTRDFGDVFSNSMEFLTSCDNLNDVNTQRWSDANPAQIEKQVQILVKIATSLFDGLANGGGANASPQFTAMLGEELRLVAQWVEWYAVAVTQIVDATTAMKHNEKLIMSIG